MSGGFFKNEDINIEIKRTLINTLSGENDKKFGYFIINKRNLRDVSVINNHPEWFDIYMKSNHQMTDPIVVKSLSRVEDFHWESSIVSQKAASKVMCQAREYNVRSGHTFLLHDYKDNLALLSIFNQPEVTSECEFTSFRESVFSLLVKIHQKILYQYESFEKDIQKEINITKRESEILYWASIGKTYKEISITTGVQIATVKFHMRNLVKKLGAVNAKHAIKLASDLKIVMFPYDKE